MSTSVCLCIQKKHIHFHHRLLLSLFCWLKWPFWSDAWSAFLLHQVGHFNSTVCTRLGTLTSLIWEGLATGQGGGGLLGGHGLGLVVPGGDGCGLEVTSAGGLCFWKAYAGMGGGLTVGRTIECLDLDGQAGLGLGLLWFGEDTKPQLSNPNSGTLLT